MINIEAKTLPHSEQRDNKVVDYFSGTDGKTSFKISELGDESYEFLAFIHEVIGSYLCRKAGIDVQQVDSFNKTFEVMRQPGDTSEPGDDSNAPYYKEYQFASNIERMLALRLGVNWKEYRGKIKSL